MCVCQCLCARMYARVRVCLCLGVREFPCPRSSPSALPRDPRGGGHHRPSWALPRPPFPQEPGTNAHGHQTSPPLSISLLRVPAHASSFLRLSHSNEEYHLSYYCDSDLKWVGAHHERPSNSGGWDGGSYFGIPALRS